jgi:hypothetical protein
MRYTVEGEDQFIMEMGELKYFKFCTKKHVICDIFPGASRLGRVSQLENISQLKSKEPFFKTKNEVSKIL